MNLPEFFIDEIEDLLTPSHSIPANIQVSHVSGSKGHSFDCSAPILKKKIVTNIPSVSQKTMKQKSPPKPLVSNYTQEKKEREAELLKLERKISNKESFELFAKIDKIAQEKRTRIKRKSVEISLSKEASSNNIQHSERKSLVASRTSKVPCLSPSPAVFPKKKGLRSSNSPEKVIQRIQKLIKIK